MYIYKYISISLGVAYVACSGCNISSYTNSNVTYSCYDISQLCPSRSISVRRNLEGTEGSLETSAGSLESEGYLETLTNRDGIDYSRSLRNLAVVRTVEDFSTYGVLLNSIQVHVL
jgi:hypothetical protein